MPPLKRLVLFVEGEGDEAAAPVLVSHFLTEMAAWDCLFLDSPFKVGSVVDLLRARQPTWKRYLGAVRKKRDLGGVLLLLDGDVTLPRREPFCAKKLALELAEQAKQEGAGTLFSLACVFALQEYESWLLGGVEALAGKLLSPDDRPGIEAGTLPPAGDLEAAPRDAKGWLGRHMAAGTYKPTLDQEPLTRLLVQDLAPLRQRSMRSFRRFEAAVGQLVQAIRSGAHVVTPPSAPAAP
jgi:hypothetical protein